MAESGSNVIENQVLSIGLSVFVVLCKTVHLDLPGQMCDSVQDPWRVELIDKLTHILTERQYTLQLDTGSRNHAQLKIRNGHERTI